jgi:hypothetical protein
MVTVCAHHGLINDRDHYAQDNDETRYNSNQRPSTHSSAPI